MMSAVRSCVGRDAFGALEMASVARFGQREGTSFVGRISVLSMREACAFMTANLNGQLG